MNLLPYLERLREQLLVAAEAGGEDARDVAERLVTPLESAARLMLLDALSNAASEITDDLAPGSVEVRLRGVDPEFVVSPPDVPAGPAVGVEAGIPALSEEGGSTRTTLRLPDHLKARVEAAAGREGLSVNTWLVRAVAASLDSGAGRPVSRPIPGTQSLTGWARS
ncbi:hypothetical protein E2F48_14775 [Arthrobacter crusticola]|uniref:Toxin-antitoxin system HicB family antitoxin n=1 Tax=Arthrobacter crusticola TaxID=2547960 RepID=A0A4R5TMZ0_9MICC|nr:hypothetical protein [Arthrobacter crusticola]TDK24045.1 hypothetical protein E2F48_14775 [Arthrobacter crusticola]